MLHEVNVASMAIDPTSNTPILILKSVKGDQAVPIWIGLLEATSIASALRNIKFDRPMTHDLFKNFMPVQAMPLPLHFVLLLPFMWRIRFLNNL